MKYRTTAARIKEAMDDCNMTATELVEKSGVSKASISQYVNGRNTPGNVSAFRIAKVLNVSPEWLMGFDVSKKPSLVNTVQFASINSLGYRYENDKNFKKNVDYQYNAMQLYKKYMKADSKTRNIIDQLLEED